jgi:hypothetical protein
MRKILFSFLSVWQDDIHYFMLNPAGLNSSHTDSLVTIVQESIPPGWESISGSLKGLQIWALDPVLKKIGWEATPTGRHSLFYFESLQD